MSISRRGLLAGMAAGLPLAPVAARGASQVIDAPPGNGQDRLQAAIDAAQASGGEVRLGPGNFQVEMLDVTGPLALTGVPGQTVLRGRGSNPVLRITGAKGVTLSGLTFASSAIEGDLVNVGDARDVVVDHCRFLGGGTGLSLRDTSGAVSNSLFRYQAVTGLFSLNARGGLQVTANRVEDIGNNGIQIWREDKGEDGSQITGNAVTRIAANAGGTGENGNGINIYKAGNVMVANNRISDCAFSAVRNNAGDHCQITANSISRTGEVAIYSEFGFLGAVISNNLVEDAAFGISITNSKEGGRLAVCSGNLLRRINGGKAAGVTVAGAIFAEADTLITSNLVEDARDFGISAGWGPYCRNVTIASNSVKDCGRGITASVTEGAGSVIISENTIVGSKIAAIMGMDHDTAKTGDLSKAGAQVPGNLVLSNNRVS